MDLYGWELFKLCSPFWSWHAPGFWGLNARDPSSGTISLPFSPGVQKTASTELASKVGAPLASTSLIILVNRCPAGAPKKQHQLVSPSYTANHSQGLWPLPTRLPWQQPLCFPITLSEWSQAARSSLLGPCQGGPSYLIGVSPYWQTLPYRDTHGSTLILNPQKPLPDTDFLLLPGLSSQGLQWFEGTSFSGLSTRQAGI